ncbi:hypothetical protein ACFLZP_02340 [Patescibacteria group bacterium]
MNKKSPIIQPSKPELPDTPQRKKASTPMILLAFITFLLGGITGYLIGSANTKAVSQADPSSPSLADTWQKPTPTTAGHISEGTDQFTTRDLHFKIPHGWWLNMSTNIYFGDNWTQINPQPLDSFVNSAFILKSVSEKFSPTISYKEFLKDIETKPITISGTPGELVIGITTPPSSPEITCPGCYLGSYKAGEKVAIALFKKDNNFYTFEGSISRYKDEYYQILSLFSFSAD